MTELYYKCQTEKEKEIYSSIQSTVDGSNIYIEKIKDDMEKVKERRGKSENIDKTVQRGIEDAW